MEFELSIALPVLGLSCLPCHLTLRRVLRIRIVGVSSLSQIAYEHPVQSLGGTQYVVSNDRKRSVPSSGSPGVVNIGQGVSEGAQVVATTSKVGARVTDGVRRMVQEQIQQKYMSSYPVCQS